jgi:succinate dehydrogenase / fumarate reductase flavoprotein subunit
MERYAPTLMDLAPRDMVSARWTARSGRAAASTARTTSTWTCATWARKVIDEKLPDITEFSRVYQGIEPITQPVPVQPTAHYAMGGIPTDIDATRRDR